MGASVIIPNYNGLKFLELCLESLLKGSVLPLEIIVVDNGSVDGSVQWLENYKKKCNILKTINLSENYGFSFAVNKGIKSAEGQYVVLLNNDTEVAYHWLEKLIDQINTDENIFSVSSKMVQFNSRGNIDDAGDFYTILGWSVKRGLNKHISHYDNDDDILAACAGAALYRKSVFSEIGYFDETFFAYLEDLDIGIRAYLNGYQNRYSAEAIVYHIGSATSGSKYNDFKVRISARNNIMLIRKNYALPMLIVNMLFIMFGILVKWMFFVRKGMGSAYAEGVMEGLRTDCKNLQYSKSKNIKFKRWLSYQYQLILSLKYLK